MAAPMPRELSTAVAQGDLLVVEQMVSEGADVNKQSKDGMTPLSIAAFWGYSDIAKFLIGNGADVNLLNMGTRWTPLHCAAFQGHGKVILTLMESRPDLKLKDMRGRTASDFASALDTIWPFFQAAGCRRTSKSDLIKMDIVQKVNYNDFQGPGKDSYAHFSRPGSAYAMRSQMPVHRDASMEAAAVTGDVLAAMPEEPELGDNNDRRSLQIWNN